MNNTENVAYILTGENLTLVLNGRAYTVPTSNRFFPQMKVALKEKNYTLLLDLIDKSKGIATATNGAISVENGVVKYGGEVIHNVVTQRILDFLQNDLPFAGLVKFLENLLQNPSKRAVEETYTFLENKSLPITEDGHFLAYKAVQHNYKDKHFGRIDNSIGKTVKVVRNTVDENWRQACSSGLHVGSIGYVQGFAHGNDKKILVKVNPRDVVSVPAEETKKMRVCEYVVISDYVEDLNEPSYRAEKVGAHPIKTVSRHKFANDTHLKLKRNKLGHFTSKRK